MGKSGHGNTVMVKDKYKDWLQLSGAIPGNGELLPLECANLVKQGTLTRQSLSSLYPTVWMLGGSERMKCMGNLGFCYLYRPVFASWENGVHCQNIMFPALVTCMPQREIRLKQPNPIYGLYKSKTISWFSFSKASSFRGWDGRLWCLAKGQNCSNWQITWISRTQCRPMKLHCWQKKQ